MHLFYSPVPATAEVDLPEEEAHHAVHVLRLAPGTLIGLLDGNGTFAEAELAAVGKRGCTVRILQRRTLPPERRSRIHLAVAPTKQMDRYEWFAEKAVEIGADRITPLITARTERTRLRTDRLLRVAVSAMKQSRRTWLPQIDEPTSLGQLLAHELPLQRFFGWCEDIHAPFTSVYRPLDDALVLIGPEGDFTPEEAGTLRGHGFQAVGLGRARLRTETAALAACTWMNFAQQDGLA